MLLINKLSYQKTCASYLEVRKKSFFEVLWSKISLGMNTGMFFPKLMRIINPWKQRSLIFALVKKSCRKLCPGVRTCLYKSHNNFTVFNHLAFLWISQWVNSVPMESLWYIVTQQDSQDSTILINQKVFLKYLSSTLNIMDAIYKHIVFPHGLIIQGIMASIPPMIIRMQDCMYLHILFRGMLTLISEGFVGLM